MAGINNPAHVTVSVVVEREGRFLLVEERAELEHQDRLVLNQPSGHWDAGETLQQGAIREALEETGWTVQLDSLIGIYDYQPPHLPYGFLRFAFAATAVSHDAARALDTGIVRAVWLTREELLAESHRHRSPMVLRCVDDYLAGRRIPLDFVAQLLPG